MKNRRLKARMAFVFICLLLPLLIFGQSKKWDSIGPEGGNIASVVQDPMNLKTMYAVLSGKPAQLYKSLDHGKSWSQIASFNEGIVQLTLNPLKPRVLYALSSGYSAAQPDSSPTLTIEPSLLYLSSDGGKSWDSKPFPPIYAALRIVFDPKDGSTIHALARTALSDGVIYLKSTDVGDTWSATEVLQGRGWATSMAVDPNNTDRIYVAAYPYMMSSGTKIIFKSENGGRDFIGLTIDSRNISQLNDLVLDPIIPGRIFVSMYSGIYRSSDGGKTWEKNRGSLSYPLKLWIDPKKQDHLMAKLDKGLAESIDGGVTWKANEGKLVGVSANSLIVETGAKPVVFASNTAGIFVTSDKGKTWKPSHKGILGTQVTSLRLAPSAPNVLFAGLMSNTVYKAKAAGTANVGWDALPVFYSCTKISDMLIDEKDPGKIFALGGGG
jgi:photosystem II stability/assembly factor-like uncharacterized protein